MENASEFKDKICLITGGSSGIGRGIALEFGKLGSNVIVADIQENSNIQIITKNKSKDEILALLNELIQEYRNENNLRKIESLEQKLINNLDENSYSELIRLKSQLNRE